MPAYGSMTKGVKGFERRRRTGDGRIEEDGKEREEFRTREEILPGKQDGTWRFDLAGREMHREHGQTEGT